MGLFDDLEIFAAVVEANSFTRAAAALQLSRARVSERIRALETRAGTRLIERSTRRVAPTEAGKAFHARCRRAIEEAQAGFAELTNGAREPVGRLRIGGIDGFTDRCLVPALVEFITSNPNVAVELDENAGIADLMGDRLDFSIRIDRDPEPGLIARRLGASRFVVVAAPAYLEQAAAPRHPRDLGQHRLVGFSPFVWGNEWRFRGSEGAVDVPVRPTLVSKSTASLRAAALAGIGLAAVPDWAVNTEVADGRLVRLLKDWDTPECGIYAVFASIRLPDLHVQSCVDHLARHFERSLQAPSV